MQGMALRESAKNSGASSGPPSANSEAKPGDVMDILNEGSRKAKVIAGETMAEVREAMKI